MRFFLKAVKGLPHPGEACGARRLEGRCGTDAAQSESRRAARRFVVGTTDTGDRDATLADPAATPGHRVRAGAGRGAKLQLPSGPLSGREADLRGTRPLAPRRAVGGGLRRRDQKARPVARPAAGQRGKRLGRRAAAMRRRLRLHRAQLPRADRGTVGDDLAAAHGKPAHPTCADPACGPAASAGAAGGSRAAAGTHARSGAGVCAQRLVGAGRRRSGLDQSGAFSMSPG
jgi:hypothetical protein